MDKKQKLLPIGTLINHSGHGPGKIIGHNNVTSQAADYAMSNRGQQVLKDIPPEVKPTMAAGIISSIYNGDRYPYIILFDSGYKDVYSDMEVIVIK